MSISDYKRIMIIGNAGSGKTTLALKLAYLVNLPLYHLDQYYWKAGWERTDSIEFTHIHAELCKRDRWIIEGCNLSWLSDRVAEAELIIFLDMPRYQCLWRVIKRCVLYYDKVIPGMAIECKQRITGFKFLEFLRWVWHFKNRSRAKIVDHIESSTQAGKPVIILKSGKEVNDFLKKIKG